MNRFVSIGAAATLLAVVGSALPADAAVPRWKLIKSGGSGEFNYFSGVHALSKTAIWTFSSSWMGPSRTRAHRFDGKTWRNVPLPKGFEGSIGSVDSSSPSDVWAATSDTELGPGIRGLIRWNGRTWKSVRTFDGRPGRIAVLGPKDVWVFDGSGADRGSGTWHYDGAAWTEVPTTFIPSSVSRIGRKVWTAGRNPYTGDPYLTRYDGKSWKKVSPGKYLPAAPANGWVGLSSVKALSANNVWYSGVVARGSQRTGFLLHWNGKKWSRPATPKGWVPGGIEGDGNGGLWISGAAAKAPATGVALSVVRHRSPSGAWYTSSPAGGSLYSFTRVPGTRTLWAGGEIRDKAQSGSKAGLWRLNG